MKRTLIGIMAFLMATMPAVSVYAAIDEITLDKFAQNNILFYDPSASGRNFCTLGDGNCYITGSTRDEQLWSGLRHVGFTPEQTAGIMGNILNEGGSPTRQEQSYIDARKQGCLTKEGKPYDIYLDATEGAHHDSCMQKISGGNYQNGGGVVGIGLSFVQWSAHNRRLGYLNIIEGMGLLKYFEGDAYKTYGQYTDSQLKEQIMMETGSDADYWALWCAAIQYIYTELSSPSYNAFFGYSSVDDIASYVARAYEVCTNCQPGQGSHDKRVQDANAVYQRYLNGEFDAVENGTATSSGTSSEGSEGAPEVQQTAIKRSGNCSVPYNVTEAEDALKIVSQFISDTNTLYGTNYLIPSSLEIGNKTLPTPNDDKGVTAKDRIWSEWVEQGIASGGKPAACWGGEYCGQCTALSGWFTTMLTGYTYGGGHGGKVVANIAAKNPGVEVTNVPTPFSVFSERSGSSYGHTGIIVGDYGDGTYLAIENNIGTHKLRVMRRTLSGFRDNGATFAILADNLKLNHIGQL